MPVIDLTPEYEEIQRLRADLAKAVQLGMEARRERDDWKQAHEDLLSVRATDLKNLAAAKQRDLAAALADPEHDEYELLVEELAHHAEVNGPIPKNEFLLTALMLFLEIRRAAQGIEAEGRDRNGLGAEHESPVGAADAPIPSNPSTAPSPAAGTESKEDAHG